jgi:co-chaperonin GroES (HSP10)
MKFEPTGNQVMVLEPVISTKTESGIIKPDSLTEEEKKGMNRLTVVAVGPDTKVCKVGDEIALNRFAPSTVTPIQLDGKVYLVFPDNCIVGVYKDSE